MPEGHLTGTSWSQRHSANEISIGAENSRFLLGVPDRRKRSAGLIREQRLDCVRVGFINETTPARSVRFRRTAAFSRKSQLYSGGTRRQCRPAKGKTRPRNWSALLSTTQERKGVGRGPVDGGRCSDPAGGQDRGLATRQVVLTWPVLLTGLSGDESCPELRHFGQDGRKVTGKDNDFPSFLGLE